MYKPANKMEPKEAKIVKLSKLRNQPAICRTTNISRLSFDNESFSSGFSEYSENEYAEISDILPKRIHVIKDYNGSHFYGDLRVQAGENVYLKCESEGYYFVESASGEQGFVPKDCCVNLEEAVSKARVQILNEQVCRVTSL